MAGGAANTAAFAGDQGVVPVGSTVVFTGDYDSGDLGQWGTCQWRDYNDSCADWDQGTYSARVVADGPEHATAARFEVRDGDVPPFGGGERAEVSAGDSRGAAVREGDERWYEFSMKFDESSQNPDGGWFIPMQWHAGSGSPPLALEVTGDGVLEFANNRTGKRTTIGDIQRGTWVDYVLHVKFSTGSGALAEASVDGVQQPGVHREPNLASDSNYLKMGIYRDGDDNGTAVVWQDGLRVTAP